MLGMVPVGLGLQWGRFPVPQQLGMTELMGRLQTAPVSTPVGLADQINALIQSASEKVANSQSVVAAQLNELNVTNGIINRTIAQVEANEEARIAQVKEYNKNVLALNGVLVEMTTGSQQINDVIATANRVKKNIANDIKRINDAISVTNDWMVKMDAWVAFVKEEVKEIDQAQANLVRWGDATKNNINLHEVAAVKLAREAFDLETQISSMTNLLLSSGKLLGYTPSTLTIAEAAGGLGWSYTYWS